MKDLRLIGMIIMAIGATLVAAMFALMLYSRMLHPNSVPILLGFCSFSVAVLVRLAQSCWLSPRSGSIATRTPEAKREECSLRDRLGEPTVMGHC